MTGQDQDDFLIVPLATLKYRLTGARQVNQSTSTVATAGAATVNTLNGAYPAGQRTLYSPSSQMQASDSPRLVPFCGSGRHFRVSRNAGTNSRGDAADRRPVAQHHHIESDAPDDFRIRNLTEISETMASTSRLMTNLLLCVAMISLVVGGVGIMNIMLVSVTGATRKIGVRMAVGSQPHDIRRQFLTEAVLLCTIGGIAGVILGRCQVAADQPHSALADMGIAGCGAGGCGLDRSGARFRILSGLASIAP